jgi:hypothetical protein
MIHGITFSNKVRLTTLFYNGRSATFEVILRGFREERHSTSHWAAEASNLTLDPLQLGDGS